MNEPIGVHPKASKKTYIVVLFVVLVAVATWLATQLPSKSSDASLVKIRFRLQWTPQAQFAGYLVAKELGYYSDAGLDVEIRSAGPDLKPQNTVAAGADDIAVGVANQVIASRSSGVPLKIIAQIFQDSANRYVLKKENAISSLTELRGKKVGLWLGGDEAEFVAMLKTVSMSLDDVVTVPQGFSVGPFLNGDYVISQVTTYNELNQIREAGFPESNLQILSPSDYQAAIVSDMLFTTEKQLRDNRKAVQSFLTASLKGWKYCADHPDKAVDIVLKFDKSLKRDEQAKQLNEVLKLVLGGHAKLKGIGYMDTNYYATAESVLFASKQISTRVDPVTVFDDSLWHEIVNDEKTVEQP